MKTNNFLFQQSVSQGLTSQVLYVIYVPTLPTLLFFSKEIDGKKVFKAECGQGGWFAYR